MAPFALPAGFDEPWEPSALNEFVLIDEGIYEVAIFEVTPEKNADGNFYKMVFRINGTEFDGEDVKLNFVGLYPKTIFRLYDILVAIGKISTYYDAENKRWIAIPTPDELRGSKLYGQIDHNDFPSKDKNTGIPILNPDGSQKVLTGNAITRFFPLSEPKPEYKKSRQRTTPASPAAGLVGADAVLAAGGSEVSTPYTGDTPW